MEKSVYFMSEKTLFSPDISEMINQATELLKLDIIQGLSYEQEPDIYQGQGLNKNPSKLGKIVANHLKSLPEKSKYNRPNYSKSLPINQLYNADIRTLTRKHNIDLLSKKAVLKQIEPARTFAYVASDIKDSSRIKNLHENLFDTEIDISHISSSPLASVRATLPHLNIDPGVARLLADRLRWFPIDLGGNNESGGETKENKTIQLNSGLKFRLHRVKCVDETNPEWPGDDEISMGGTSVNCQEVAEKINEFRVGNSFDDGESKRYSPPRILKIF